jgi:hypothetical protein
MFSLERSVERLLDAAALIGGRGAVANAAGALADHTNAMAAVDSVVERLHRHATASQPAA